MTVARRIQPSEIQMELQVEDIETQQVPGMSQMAEEDYHRLVTSLIMSGETAAKKSALHVFPLAAHLRLVTTNGAGGHETAKTSAPEDLRVVFDGMLYSMEAARNVWLTMQMKLATNRATLDDHQIARINMGQAREVFNVRGEGLWTMTGKNFRNEYEPDIDGNALTYKVKPGTQRLILPVTQDTGFIAQWGKFDIRAGGAIAMRPDDVPALIDALQDIKAGTKTVAEALFTTKPDGSKVARFDIYGMDPGFRELNYEAATMSNQEAAARIGAFRQSNISRPAFTNASRPKLS